MRPADTPVDPRLVDTLLSKYHPPYRKMGPLGQLFTRVGLVWAWQAQDEIVSLWDFTRELYGWNNGEYS